MNAYNQTVNCTLLPYQFEPIAMVGGMLWTIGNCSVVPIIGLIGLGLGMLLWGLANMVVGWTIGIVGIGSYIKAGTVNTPALNYAGLAVAVASFVLYFFVKVEKKPASGAGASGAVNGENLPLVSGGQSLVQNNSWEEDIPTSRSTIAAPMSDVKKKVIGAVLACGAGLCYGFNMAPVMYLAQKYPCAGPFAFAFSHFSGIFFTSTIIMLFYAIFKKNKPYIEPRSVIGGLAAGTLWAIAQCAWFASNMNLGAAVAFPIITTGPALVANLWGVFYFKEIQGRNNRLKLLGAFSVTVAGIILIALSKVEF